MSDAVESAIMSSISSLPDRDPDMGGRVDDGGGDSVDNGDSGVDNSVEAQVHGSTDDSDAPAGDSDPAVGDAAAAETQVDEHADPFAKEFGLTEPKPGQRENRIPYNRVKVIATNAQKKTFKALTGEDIKAGETVEQAVERASATFRETTSRHAEAVKALREYDHVGTIMERQPDQFVEMLFNIHPRYKELFSNAQANRGRTDERLGDKPGDPGPRPEPDLELGDGSRTFSVEGLQKLMDWQAAKAEQRLREQYDARLQPFEKERAEAEKTAKVRAAAVGNINNVMKYAVTWDGFKENEAAILEAIQKDTRPMLPWQAVLSAYMEVVIPKYKADRAKMRTEILEELRKAPTSTGIKPGSAVRVQQKPAQSDAPVDTEDVIRQAIAGLKR